MLHMHGASNWVMFFWMRSHLMLDADAFKYYNISVSMIYVLRKNQGQFQNSKYLRDVHDTQCKVLEPGPMGVPKKWKQNFSCHLWTSEFNSCWHYRGDSGTDAFFPLLCCVWRYHVAAGREADNQHGCPSPRSFLRVPEGSISSNLPLWNAKQGAAN